MIVDENYINYHLFLLYNTEKLFSLNEMLFDIWPEHFMGGPASMRALMSAQVWQFFFPGVVEKYSNTHKVDFRCGFHHHFLEEGNLQNHGMSRIQFQDGNKIDLDLHFGCKLFVFDDSNKAAIDQVMEYFSILAADEDDEHWKHYSSIFFSLEGTVTMDFDEYHVGKQFPFEGLIPIPSKFHDDFYTGQPFIMGKVAEFTPLIKELRVFTQGRIDHDRADFLTDKLRNWKQTSEESSLKYLVNFMSLGMPLVPFPRIEECLGLKENHSTMQIKEGFAMMAFDYEVEKSHIGCLFAMRQTLIQKEIRVAHSQQYE